MPTQNTQKADNVFYNSEEQTDKFILFLKKTVRQERGLFGSKNNLQETDNTVKNNNYNIKYEIIEKPEYIKKESRLAKVLDIKNNYKEIDNDYDVEEEITENWLSDIKKFHTSMPKKQNLPKGKSGFKINLKDQVKILMPPSFNNFLPSELDRKKITISKSLTAPVPLALKLATFIIIAFVLSVFTQLSSSKLSEKIISFSDNIFSHPVNQLNLFVVNIMPELIAGNDKFYNQVDKIISESKKIKSDYILKNQNKLENTQNKNSILITREDLLGLPVNAHENADIQDDGETWQVKTDIILQKLGNSAEYFLTSMVKKQTEISFILNEKLKNLRK